MLFAALGRIPDPQRRIGHSGLKAITQTDLVMDGAITAIVCSCMADFRVGFTPESFEGPRLGHLGGGPWLQCGSRCVLVDRDARRGPTDDRGRADGVPA